MRRPHLTDRVIRGLEILADVPPLLRTTRQRRDAQRAIQWVMQARHWKAQRKVLASLSVTAQDPKARRASIDS